MGTVVASAAIRGDPQLASAADHRHGCSSLGDRPPDWHQNEPTGLGGSSQDNPYRPYRIPCLFFFGSRGILAEFSHGLPDAGKALLAAAA